MARGPRYRVPFRRRRERKTDYRLRKGLILAELPRLVARGSSKHMIVQFIEARIDGDHTLVSSHSSELLKSYGWKGSCSNLPAAYLTGFLCGLKAINSEVKSAVLDIGLRRSSKGARVFAVLKGALDAGVEVPNDPIVLPDDERVAGQHLVEYANLLFSSPEIYERRFSKYLSQNLDPRKITDHFFNVKNNIISSFKDVKA